MWFLVRPFSSENILVFEIEFATFDLVGNNAIGAFSLFLAIVNKVRSIELVNKAVKPWIITQSS